MTDAKLSRRLFMARGALLAAGALVLPEPPAVRRFFFMPWVPPIADGEIRIYVGGERLPGSVRTLQEAYARLPTVIEERVIVHMGPGVYYIDEGQWFGPSIVKSGSMRIVGSGTEGPRTTNIRQRREALWLPSAPQHITFDAATEAECRRP